MSRPEGLILAQGRLRLPTTPLAAPIAVMQDDAAAGWLLRLRARGSNGQEVCGAL